MPKQLPKGLEVRPFRASDVQSLLDLLVAAPDDGTLYRLPHVLEYPDEMRTVHEGWLRPELLSDTTLIRLAVAPTSDTGGSGGDGETMVVGFSSWQKKEVTGEGKTKAVAIDDTTKAVEAAKAEEAKNPASAPAEESAPAAADTSGPSKALQPDPKHAAAIRRARKRASSPSDTHACYVLTGLAVHPSVRGCGIASLLVRWGLDRAAAEGVPVFAAGETSGIALYCSPGLRFQRLRDSEYWLDKEGEDISRETVEAGDNAWTKEKGGLSGAEVVWCPKGYRLEVNGQVYEGGK